METRLRQFVADRVFATRLRVRMRSCQQAQLGFVLQLYAEEALEIGGPERRLDELHLSKAIAIDPRPFELGPESREAELCPGLDFAEGGVDPELGFHVARLFRDAALLHSDMLASGQVVVDVDLAHAPNIEPVAVAG